MVDGVILYTWQVADLLTSLCCCALASSGKYIIWILLLFIPESVPENSTNKPGVPVGPVAGTGVCGGRGLCRADTGSHAERRTLTLHVQCPVNSAGSSQVSC